MRITIEDLDAAYGRPGDWFRRVVLPDGKVELTSGGDAWRVWQSENWDNLFWIVNNVWTRVPNGSRIQLYVDRLVDLNGKRIAEWGPLTHLIHADLLVENTRNMRHAELFEKIVPDFIVTSLSSPELFPSWIPHKLRSAARPSWEDLL